MEARASDPISYYYLNGQRIPLQQERNIFALRQGTGWGSLSKTAVELLRRRASPIDFIASYGIKLYRTAAADRAARTLDADDTVEFATPVFRQTFTDSPREGSENPADVMILTRRFVAQFNREMTRDEIDALNRENGAHIVEELGYAENAFLLEATGGGLSGLQLANRYFESGYTVWSHPDFVKRRHTKHVATAVVGHDPSDAVFLDTEWHLRMAKVIEAWVLTTGSPEIAIAILDDGVDTQHPEFVEKIDPTHVSEWDFERGIADGNPKLVSDNHGTACAGVATAAGKKVAGVAPDCRLIPVRTPLDLAVADEAKMFQWAADAGADVISCSWGPADGTGENDPLPDSTRVAIEYCLSHGRTKDGVARGIPIFWAAGNGDESVMLDGYASNPDVVAVGASTSSDTRAFYSDQGAAIWICAPSSGDTSAGEQRIFTADRRGADGYNLGAAENGDADGDCTNDFGGTSSAAPLVAGVAALMLSVNPDLSADQVRRLLATSADRIGTGYDASGHSDEFGYGRVNALAAILAAQSAVTTSVPRPSIVGPVSIARAGGAPHFDVSSGSNSFYAVEVAAASDLLAAGASGRDESNYFASWDESSLFDQSPYVLPAKDWELLRNNARLYYRVWTSSSSDAWTAEQVSTADSDLAQAPSLEIIDVPATRGAGQPRILGPLVVDRGGPAPQFEVSPGSNDFYAVEIAASAELLASGASGGPSEYFASWGGSGFYAASPYRLPEQDWERLQNNQRLYYRVWTSSSSDAWSDEQTSTPDSGLADAPSLGITGGAAPSGDEDPAPVKAFERREGFGAETPRRSTVYPRETPPAPVIVGPDVWHVDDSPPSFLVTYPGDFLYVVEVATNRHLLERAAGAHERSSRTFYASWEEGDRQGCDQTVYTLPHETWQTLKPGLVAGKRRNSKTTSLYYRVMAVPIGSDDPADEQWSTPSVGTSAAPVVTVRLSVDKESVDPRSEDVRLGDERHWRSPAPRRGPAVAAHTVAAKPKQRSSRGRRAGNS